MRKIVRVLATSALVMVAVFAAPGSANAADCDGKPPCGAVRNESNWMVATYDNFCNWDGGDSFKAGDPLRDCSGTMRYVRPGEFLGGYVQNLDIDTFRAATNCTTRANMSAVAGKWTKFRSYRTAVIRSVSCPQEIECHLGNVPEWISGPSMSTVSIDSARTGTTLEIRYNSGCAWARISRPKPGAYFWVDHSTDGGRHWRQLSITWGGPRWTPAYNDSMAVMRACGNIDGDSRVRCTDWF
jgi:hypothetical protein